MKYRLFRKADYVMGAVGLILGCVMWYFDFMIDHGILILSKNVLWAVFITILCVGGLICGKFISVFHRWSYRDSLTDSWNRKYFYHKIHAVIEEKIKSNKVYCIALFDIDNFKQVNDTYGHTKGDEVIKSVANILQQSVRADDDVVRLGGDEFAIIFPETEMRMAQVIAERIRGFVADTCNFITVSVGVIEVKRDLNAKEIIEFVDTVLYKAKLEKNAVKTMAV